MHARRTNYRSIKDGGDLTCHTSQKPRLSEGPTALPRKYASSCYKTSPFQPEFGLAPTDSDPRGGRKASYQNLLFKSKAFSPESFPKGAPEHPKLHCC